MRVLVAFERFGITRDAFRRLGHDAWSVDLSPGDTPSPYHRTEDVFGGVLDEGWDLIIAHPPCTYLASSGLHWNKRIPGREALTNEAVDMVRRVWATPAPRFALENPVGRLSTAWRKPDQYIQPYDFGHDASKRTCLWLRGLPLLQPTRYVPPRMVGGRPRWGNQTDSGQNRLGPSPTRAMDRARTYSGWAEAMATQWT